MPIAESHLPPSCIHAPSPSTFSTEFTRIWGDFWVYNYKQEGDTLKCVSGGSHPGLMHVCQMGEKFYVSDFEQVEDSSSSSISD